jgi:DNA-directed RNA polymerase specialized sigma24 family protein
MSVSNHAPDRRTRFAGLGEHGGRCGHAARHQDEAEVLDQLSDSDIMTALRGLPTELRLTVYLADVEGCGYQEIAEIMGTPVGTVASRLHHGRGRLRARLADCALRHGLAVTPG